MRFFKIHKAFTCAFCRIPASRFARCPWVYLYEVRGRWAWGLSAMPTAAQAASAPLMPFCRFCPRSVERRGQRRFRLVYAAKRRRTTALRFIDQLSQSAQFAKAARFPFVYVRSFGARFRGAKPCATTFRRLRLARLSETI